MQNNSATPEACHVAFIDIGTNSVRWMLVRINPNRSYVLLSKQKEAIRLGEGEFATQVLQPEAMQRAIQVCKSFADLSRLRQAREIIAGATSATREADNQAEFVQCLKEEAGLDVHVISGQEEARLIYLGVASGIHLGNDLALFMDIGGGSTEVIAGNQHEHRFLETHRLGAIRLASLFFLPDESAPVSPDRYALIKNYARNALVRTVQHLRDYRFTRFIGSSGTIINLAQVTSRYRGEKDLTLDMAIKRKHLSETIQMLCSLPLEERRQVSGINPERADIIIPGGAIIETFMEALDLEEFQVSDRGMLDGLLVDYLERSGNAAELGGLSVRERSIIQLGRTLNFEEAHARNVSRIALQLFDSAREIGLHNYGESYRELLHYAAIVHDIGTFVSYQNHQAHTHYLILNSPLLGFDETEIHLMANIALFHRKGIPRSNRKELYALSKDNQEAVRVLSMFLRLAESLDRSHSGIVVGARLVDAGNKRILLELTCAQDCQIEVWGVNTNLDSFKKTFGKQLEVSPAD